MACYLMTVVMYVIPVAIDEIFTVENFQKP